MGFWSRLLGIDSFDAAQRVLPEPFEPFFSTAGIPVMDPGAPLANWIGGNADAEHMWRTQPNIRKVVGFAARNVASIPLHVHERVSDNERRRVVDHPLARVMSTPRPRVGAYRFWEAVISDGLLYDRWGVLKRIESDGSMRLSRVPAWRLRFTSNVLGEVEAAYFWNDEEWIELDLDLLIFDHGYGPKTAGLSPVDTLRDLLDESAEAVEYRRQVWANGARAPQYVTRPAGAQWPNDDARERFVAGMRAYMKDGAKAGGVPLLEDGMELKDGTRMPSKDMLDLEGRQLSAVEVASAFYIAPELIGAREGNYSNVDAYRQMLYRDSLGPYVTAWEQAINVGLTPDLAEGRPLYVEANMESKLRGSFQEQAQIMQSATGAPWLTRNEARSLQNRPPVEGGDALVVPLNVLTGGQASPQDSGTQNLRSAPARRSKAPVRAPETHEERFADLLKSFFARQGRVVQSRLGAGDDWWDGKRWDDELSADLLRMYALSSETAARAVLEAAGADDYDVNQTLAFLAEAARLSAEDINETTKAQIDSAIDDEDGDPETVFDNAQSQRASEIAATVVTFASGFGAVEAAKQNGGGTKTWVVTSTNPRSSHARMNGETVPLDEDFSNGLKWPGSIGDAAEVAGCRCAVQINF